MKETRLGEFEEVILLLVGILGEEAYAFKIAEEFCARETRTNNIKIAEHRMIFFSFIIVQFLNRKIFKEFASFNNSLQNTSQLNRQGVVMTSNRGKGLKWMKNTMYFYCNVVINPQTMVSLYAESGLKFSININ